MTRDVCVEGSVIPARAQTVSVQHSNRGRPEIHRHRVEAPDGGEVKRIPVHGGDRRVGVVPGVLGDGVEGRVFAGDRAGAQQRAVNLCRARDHVVVAAREKRVRRGRHARDHSHEIRRAANGRAAARHEDGPRRRHGWYERRDVAAVSAVCGIRRGDDDARLRTRRDGRRVVRACNRARQHDERGAAGVERVAVRVARLHDDGDVVAGGGGDGAHVHEALVEPLEVGRLGDRLRGVGLADDNLRAEVARAVSHALPVQEHLEVVAPGSHGDVLADVDALVRVVREFGLDDARGPVRAEGHQPRLENHRHEAVVLVRHAVLGKRQGVRRVDERPVAGVVAVRVSELDAEIRFGASLRFGHPLAGDD